MSNKWICTVQNTRMDGSSVWCNGLGPVHMRVPVSLLAAPFSIQLSDNDPEKAAKDSTNIWALAIYMEDLDGVPGFSLEVGPVLPIVTIWGVNQKTKNFSLSLSMYPYTFSDKQISNKSNLEEWHQVHQNFQYQTVYP